MRPDEEAILQTARKDAAGVDCKRIGKLLGGVGDKRHRIVCNLSTEVKEGRKGMEEGKEEKERKERKEKKGS